MKKFLSTILASTLALSTLATTTSALTPLTTPLPLQEAYTKTLYTPTFDVMRSLYALAYQNCFNYGESDIEHASFADISGNGIDELILCFKSPTDGVYYVDIWSYNPTEQRITQAISMPTWEGMSFHDIYSAGVLEDGQLFLCNHFFTFDTDFYHDIYSILVGNPGEFTSLETKATTSGNSPNPYFWEKNEVTLSQNQFDQELAYWESRYTYQLSDTSGTPYDASTYYTHVVNPGFTTTEDVIQNFSDVSHSDWNSSFIRSAVESGAMTVGYTPTQFNPEGWATRGMGLEVISSLWGRYVAWEVASSPLFNDQFPDLEGTMYNKFLAGDPGCFSGYENGNFGVNDPITREAFAGVLYKLANVDYVQENHLVAPDSETTSIYDFSDVDSISSWAVQGMDWAVKKGLLHGSQGKLRPQDPISRAEMAVMANNAQDVFILP